MKNKKGFSISRVFLAIAHNSYISLEVHQSYEGNNPVWRILDTNGKIKQVLNRRVGLFSGLTFEDLQKYSKFI